MQTHTGTPFMFITTHKVAEGQADQLKALAEEYSEFVKEREPDMLAHYTFSSEDGGELSLIHVLADAAAADRHLQVVSELIARSSSFTAGNSRIEVYGEPGPLLDQALEGNRRSGTQVSVMSEAVAGFGRH